MNRAQKTAWFHLLTAVSLGVSFGAVIILALIVGMPKAWLGMGFMGLMALGQLIFRKEEDRNKVQFDERDLLIQKRASLWDYCASYGFFVAFSSITYSVVGKGDLVSVNILPIMIVGGVVVLLTMRSVAVLVQYGRSGKGEK